MIVVVETDRGDEGFPIVDETEVGFDAPDGDKTEIHVDNIIFK